MNLATLDRAELETILLDPPHQETEPLQCFDGSLAAYLPPPLGLRATRVRHVLAVAHELLTRIAADQIRGRSVIDRPQVLKEYFQVHFAGADRESFVVVFLDAQHRVIEAEELFAGTLTQTSVYPREVVRRALHHNAAAVAFGHNHPSGHNPEPSRADEHLTTTLKVALGTVDVRVIDHIVVGTLGTVSFAERGLL